MCTHCFRVCIILCYVAFKTFFSFAYTLSIYRVLYVRENARMPCTTLCVHTYGVYNFESSDSTLLSLQLGRKISIFLTRTIIARPYTRSSLRSLSIELRVHGNHLLRVLLFSTENYIANQSKQNSTESQKSIGSHQ